MASPFPQAAISVAPRGDEFDGPVQEQDSTSPLVMAPGDDFGPDRLGIVMGSQIFSTTIRPRRALGDGVPSKRIRNLSTTAVRPRRFRARTGG